MKTVRVSKTPLSKLFQIEKGFTPQTYRVGIILAFVIYGAFGYLDYYAMPSNYVDSWILRYAVIVPLLVVAYALSYHKQFIKYRKVALFLLLISGLLGILYMIAISVPGDLAYYSYYAGLILVMLWACFVFRINFANAVFITVATVLLYNITAFIFQDVYSHSYGSKPWLIILNNNYFLISAGFLAIIGAYLIEGQDKEIKRVHDELVNEKKELEGAKQKAEESDRLKSAFLANISHEIRTPLNAIIGFSDLLTDSYFSQEQISEFAKYVKQNGDALLSVIDDIMDISKIEAGQITIRKSRLSVDNLVTELHHEFLLKSNEKGIELKTNLADNNEEIFIESDGERIRQVLVNLLTNAIKFTEVGSVEIGVINEINSVRIYVSDTGIGILPEHHEHIFERFWQVDSSKVRKHGGNGLGLTISKNLAKILGGDLRLDSIEGVGSTFTLIIPKN